MKKQCVIYANCQGRGIAFLLERSEAFHSLYQIEIIENYKLIADKSAVPTALLANADLFIYQPVANRHGPYSTSAMLPLLGNGCRRISFPYIYNDALWPLFEEGEVIKGKEAILDLIEQGLSLKQIIDMFCVGGIDFRFGDRFRLSMEILRDKEAETDIKVADFIVKNLSRKKLFLTQNHQTSALYLHCANQVLEILRIPALPADDRWHPNAAGLPDCWPASPYERSYFDQRYPCDWRVYHPDKKDSNWHRFYLNIIGKIYCTERLPWLKRVFWLFYLRMRVKRSLWLGEGYLEEGLDSNFPSVHNGKERRWARRISS